MTARYALFLGCLVPTRLPQIEVSCRKVFGELGVEFDEEYDFSCCPNSPYIKPMDTEAWRLLAARNLSLVEEEGLTIVTPCPGCSNTLLEAKHELDHDRALRERVNERLKTIDREYKASVAVKHLLQVLVEDVGLEKVEEGVKAPMDLKVATHYGCHLLKPSAIVGFEDPFTARSLEDLTEAVGSTPVRYDERDTCCGMVLGSTDPDGSSELAHRKLSSAKGAGAQAIMVTCPTCFLQFDMGQLKASRRYSIKYDLPVLYFTQLIGLAIGFDQKEMGIGLHKVRPTWGSK